MPTRPPPHIKNAGTYFTVTAGTDFTVTAGTDSTVTAGMQERVRRWQRAAPGPGAGSQTARRISDGLACVIVTAWPAAKSAPRHGAARPRHAPGLSRFTATAPGGFTGPAP